MWKIAIVVFLTGAAMVGYSVTLDPYHDEARFWRQLATLAYFDDEAFTSLRASSLTAKYQLQDYGITLMATGAIAFLATRTGKPSVRSPKSRAVLILIALALPVLTSAGAGFDIMQAFNRGEFPPWSDAVMIPLLGLPILFVPLVLWSLFHLGMFWPLRNRHIASVALALSRRTNWWLLAVSAITAGLTVYLAALGHWWLALPGVTWLYYYLSLAADKVTPRTAVTT
jgi:hypothetical protein